MKSGHNTFYQEFLKTVAEEFGIPNEGFSTWFNSLPDDDWSADFESATPIRWDTQRGWIEE